MKHYALKIWNRITAKRKMDYIKIINSPENITPNFTLMEYWKPLYGGGIDFDMPVCLANAMQVIRDYYSAKYNKPTPFLITSVLRPNDWGEHKIGAAVDTVPYNVGLRQEVINDIRNELKGWKESKLVKSILVTGVTVVIIENNCCHLAYRTDKLNTHLDYTPSRFYLGSWIPSTDTVKYPYGINECYA